MTSQEERLFCKVFEQTQASSPTDHTLVFLIWEKFLPGSDDELWEELLACSVPTKCIDSDENQTPSPHHGNIIPPIIFQWLQTHHRSLHQVI